jgi:hypothetical protein
MAIKYILNNTVHPFYLGVEADLPKSSASPAYVDNISVLMDVGKTIYLTDSGQYYMVTGISGSVTSIVKFKFPAAG